MIQDGSIGLGVKFTTILAGFNQCTRHPGPQTENFKSAQDAYSMQPGELRRQASNNLLNFPYGYQVEAAGFKAWLQQNRRFQPLF